MRMRSLMLASVSFGLLAVAGAEAQTTASAPERVVVYGTLSGSDIGLAPDKVAGSLQSLSADALTAGHGATVLDALGSQRRPASR